MALYGLASAHMWCPLVGTFLAPAELVSLCGVYGSDVLSALKFALSEKDLSVGDRRRLMAVRFDMRELGVGLHARLLHRDVLRGMIAGTQMLDPRLKVQLLLSEDPIWFVDNFVEARLGCRKTAIVDHVVAKCEGGCAFGAQYTVMVTGRSSFRLYHDGLVVAAACGERIEYFEAHASTVRIFCDKFMFDTHLANI